MFAVLLIGSLLSMYVAPALVLAPALVVWALVGGVILFSYPYVNLLVLLGACALLLESRPGIQISEAVVGPYLLLYLAHWYARQAILGRALVSSWVDVAMLLFVLGGFVWGIGMGVVHRAEVGDMQGDVLSFLFFGLYFPVRDACASVPRAPWAIGAILLWYASYAVLYNVYWLWYTVTSATALWQIVDVRTNLGELPIMTAALILLAMVGLNQSWRRRLLVVLAFGVIFGGLILTKSRGYWVAFFLGALIVGVLLSRRELLRLTTISLLSVAGLTFAMLTVFKTYATLIIAGTFTRFETLQTAATQDISLLNRFVESGAVWERIMVNPIAGSGFGTTYRFFDIIAYFTKDTAFIHNGYLAIWYKLGVLGLLLAVAVWLGTISRGAAAIRRDSLPRTVTALCVGAVASLVAGLLVAITSNPFAEIDTVLTMTLTLALVNGVADRSRTR
ncbi:MAG: O-antigen ligase family protein [Bacteroidota bacterium]